MAAGLKIFWFTQLTASLLASKAQKLEQVPRQYGSRVEDVLICEAHRSAKSHQGKPTSNTRVLRARTLQILDLQYGSRAEDIWTQKVYSQSAGC